MTELPKTSCNRARLDLTGQRVGRWTVKWRVPDSLNYTCQCDCGTVRDVPGKNLRRESTKSCGCARKGAVEAARAERGAEWTAAQKANAATAGPKREITAYAQRMRSKHF